VPLAPVIVFTYVRSALIGMLAATLLALRQWTADLY
jgi:hypothetical protein